MMTLHCLDDMWFLEYDGSCRNADKAVWLLKA